MVVAGVGMQQGPTVVVATILLLVAIVGRPTRVKLPGHGQIDWSHQITDPEQASRVTKRIATEIPAAGIATERAAGRPGFHAQFLARSANAVAHRGDVVQCSVVYQNVGTESWVKGGPQVDITSVPLGDTWFHNQGWGQGQNWLSSERFAAQANDLVAPGALGSWVWSMRVPEDAASREYVVNFQPVVWDFAIGLPGAIRITVEE